MNKEQMKAVIHSVYPNWDLSKIPFAQLCAVAFSIRKRKYLSNINSCDSTVNEVDDEYNGLTVDEYGLHYDQCGSLVD